MFNGLKEKMQDLIESILEGFDTELVELNLQKHQKTLSLEIVAEKKKGQITIEDCALINKEVIRILEMDPEGVDPNNISITVSSPGLDRPLETEKDFMRVRGKEIQLFLKQPFENKREFKGVVLNAHDDCVSIQAKTQKISIPLEQIVRANQIIQT